jgi:peptidyl-prolyl cis-trans isomerase B (cyclophilin B)
MRTTGFVGLIGAVAFGLVLSSCNKEKTSSSEVGATNEAEAQASASEKEKKENVMVEMETSKGTIKIELYADKAPLTVANFLQYVKDGFYSNTIFHRVIDGFMIQGGGFESGFKEKETRAPIKNESNNGLKNEAMTLAMARTNDPNSASAQFFINLVNNPYLNGTASRPGYAVFGKVIEGQDIVEAIGKAKTTTKDFYEDVPVEEVVIKGARIISAP